MSHNGCGWELLSEVGKMKSGWFCGASQDLATLTVGLELAWAQLWPQHLGHHSMTNTVSEFTHYLVRTPFCSGVQTFVIPYIVHTFFFPQCIMKVVYNWWSLTEHYIPSSIVLMVEEREHQEQPDRSCAANKFISTFKDDHLKLTVGFSTGRRWGCFTS